MLNVNNSQSQLLDLIKRQGEITLKQAVHHTELSKTTIREHMTILEKDGYIERTARREGRGRPELIYRLTNRGHKLYPSMDSNILRDLLRYLQRKDQKHLIKEFFEQFWDRRYEEVKFRLDQAGNRDMETKIDILRHLLEEQGFMPNISLKDNGHVVVEECNCPFTETIKETKLPCKLEAMFIKKILRGELSRVKYIPDGNHSCTYNLQTQK